MRYAARTVAISLLAMLAACGTTTSERASGGGAAGAATGAGIGALAGPPGIVVGALVGGGAGASTGAATSPNEVNLGKPPWTNPQTRIPTPSGTTRTASRSTNKSQKVAQNRQEAAAELARCNAIPLERGRAVERANCINNVEMRVPPHSPDIDLIVLDIAYRDRIAAQVDLGEISPEDARVQFAQKHAQIAQLEHQRVLARRSLPRRSG